MTKAGNIVSDVQKGHVQLDLLQYSDTFGSRKTAIIPRVTRMWTKRTEYTLLINTLFTFLSLKGPKSGLKVVLILMIISVILIKVCRVIPVVLFISLLC